VSTKIKKPGEFRASALPGKKEAGVWEKRGGKTRYDRETGSTAQRLANRQTMAEWHRSGGVFPGHCNGKKSRRR